MDPLTTPTICHSVILYIFNMPDYIPLLTLVNHKIVSNHLKPI